MTDSHKERHGRRAVRSLVAAVAVLLAGACGGRAATTRDAGTRVPAVQAPGTGPAAGDQAPAAARGGDAKPVTARVLRKAPPMSGPLAAEIGRRPVAEIVPYLMSADADERRIAVRALGRVGGDEAAQEAATLLRDPDPDVREEACFAIGVTGSPLAAALLGPILDGKPSTAEVAAAAAGLANCKDDAAGDLLVRLCLRDEMPVEAPEALFRYARWRGRPWEGGLPDDGLLRYEKHATPRGRAAIGWFGRVWKDPALLPALERLAQDADPEVRRAVALGLAEGKPPAPADAADPPKTRAEADAGAAVAVLTRLADDDDVGVVVAAIRALSSYDRPVAVAVVRGHLDDASFHVRTTAAEGLGARKDVAAFYKLNLLATGNPSANVFALPDTSPSVRYAAAKACLAIDEKRARAVGNDVLMADSDFVRSAGAEILAHGSDTTSAARMPELAVAVQLAALVTGDNRVYAVEAPGIRLREAALDGLKGKDSPEARDAVAKALVGTDPVLAAIAADVAATNGWTECAPAMRTAFARFAGTPGADAREGIVAALAKLGDPADDVLLSRTAADDPDASVRTAARAAFAERAGIDAPPFDRRPRPEGATLPLGAKLLDRDVDLVVETTEGTMVIQLDASEAPIHAAHLADLARKGFYDGLTWHRVVADFVIQGGCPRGDGSGNAGVTLPLEPTRTPFVRGTLGMPRSNHPDTGGCQLFICHSRAPHLDVQYAAIGQVVRGLDVIDRIDVGSKIVRVRVADRAADGK